jgi:hypothetical protein
MFRQGSGEGNENRGFLRGFLQNDLSLHNYHKDLNRHTHTNKHGD